MPGNMKNKVIHDDSYALGNKRRTAFGRKWPLYTAFDAGKIIPIYCEYVEPNQNKSLKESSFFRTLTPLGPVLDNAYLDLFFFYVPFREVWDHWEDFITGQAGKPYNAGITYTVPKIVFETIAPPGEGEEDTDYHEYEKSFLDYLPQATDPVLLRTRQEDLYSATEATNIANTAELNKEYAIDALPARAYIKIYNDWFRPEFLEEPLEEYTGDLNMGPDDFAFNLLDPNELLVASKLHNIFTDATPEPSMGADVLIPMDELSVGAFLKTAAGGNNPNFGNILGDNDKDKTKGAGAFVQAHAAGALFGGNPIIANNVSNTIRQLTIAYKTNLLLNKDINFGTRYGESLRSHFDLQLSLARQGRAEYLGWRRIGMNSYQITNTAESASSALGNVGGQNSLADNGHLFSHAFPEHGVVLGVAVFRTNFSIGSGIHPKYQQFDRFDKHWPEFNHIGRVPLKTKSLDCNVINEGEDELVFGYIPYGEHERTAFGISSSLFRYRASGSLSYLTYQEQYVDNDYPNLSTDWLKQDRSVVDNTLIVQNGTQLYGYIKFEEENTLLLDPTSTMSLRM